MTYWRQFVRDHLPPLNLGGAREAQVIEELAHQLEDCYEDLLARGMGESEARTQAEAQFPEWARLAAEIRAARAPVKEAMPEPLRRHLQREDSPRWLQAGKGKVMSDLWQDLKYALRTLGKQPGFTAIVLLTLALGIGANTAIFGVLRAVVLKPLPYPAPERLFMLWEGQKNGDDFNMGYPTFADWRSQSKSFDSMAAISYWNPTLSIAGSEPESVEGASVTSDFFRTLGVAPMLGRDFTAQDDVPNAPRIAIISHRLWQRRFGGDPNIVGRPALMGGAERTIIGVMPPDFQSLMTHHNQPAEIWRPLGYAGETPPACRTCRHLRTVARVRAGLSLQQADAELDAISQNQLRDHPKDYSKAGVVLQPLHEQFAGESRTAMFLLFGAVGFVLLVACANVASLMLARSAARQKEIAVRISLGAGRGRIARQLLSESLLLALAGGSLGIALAGAATRALVGWAPTNIPRLDQVQVDFAALGFALGASLFTGILFGLVPCFSAGRVDLHGTLKETRSSASPPRQRMRSLLVIADVALAIVLLAGAGLMVKSLWRLMSVHPGFERENVLTLDLSLFGPTFLGDGGLERERNTYDQFFAKLRALPGVKAVGGVSQIPLGQNSDIYGVRFKDKPIANPANAPGAYRIGVTPGYLEAMQIPLLRGRPLTEYDRVGAPPVLLINEQFAKSIWPGEDPIGKRVQMGGPDAPWREVVGVVGSTRQRTLDRPVPKQMYVPEAQWEWMDDLTLAIRADGDAAALAASVRQAVWSVTPHVRISRVMTMEHLVSESVAQQRFTMTLLALFAGMAVLLAAIGIYGVMAQGVTQRTGEIGIRMALGARPAQAQALIISGGMRWVVAGVGAGLCGAIVLTRFLRDLLYEVSPTDPATLACVALALAAVALGACWIPARRAARVDPLVALRYE